MALPQDVSVTRGPDARDSWDPYHIWLTRVKQPRDRLPQRATLVVDETPAAVTDPQPNPPLLLRGAN